MIKTFVVEDGKEPIPEKIEHFYEFLEGDSFIHYACSIQPYRPGFDECITTLEHTHYKPLTERNELFIFRLIAWDDMLWGLISIPYEERNLMEEVSKQCGLRIADGVPTLIVGKKVSQPFPPDNMRIFTLENGHNHPVYQNDPVVNEQVMAAEQATVERIGSKK